MRAEISAMVLLAACTGSGADWVLEPTEDAPAVADYGMLDVIPEDEWNSLGPQEAIDKYGIHDTIGPAETGHLGGSTYRFIATGGDVCIFTDPELVYWGQSISPIAPISNYQYSDNYDDDGDIDLFAGISAFYTGSPGVEMGDFYGVYTDSQGQQVSIAYNECLQNGAKQGFTESHSGRGTPEFCTLDTEEREGVEFTVAMQTFAVPLDDGKLDFVAAVVGANCSDLALSAPKYECKYHGERFQRDDESDDDYAITVLGMEDAYCSVDPETDGPGLAQYCCEHDDEYPDLCGEPPDSSFCAQFEK
jgi:hypothetical protein